MRFLGPALGAGPLAEPFIIGVAGDETVSAAVNWLRRLLRFATASSASRFETRTGEGCRTGTGSATGGWGSSERVGEMLLSPALSLLMLLSPILFNKIKTSQNQYISKTNTVSRLSQLIVSDGINQCPYFAVDK